MLVGELLHDGDLPLDHVPGILNWGRTRLPCIWGNPQSSSSTWPWLAAREGAALLLDPSLVHLLQGELLAIDVGDEEHRPEGALANLLLDRVLVDVLDLTLRLLHVHLIGGLDMSRVAVLLLAHSFLCRYNRFRAQSFLTQTYNPPKSP